MFANATRRIFWVPVLIGVAAATVLAVAAVVMPGASSYTSLNENFPGTPTALASSLLHLVVYLSSALTIGSLVVGIVMIPARRDGTVTPPAARAFGWAAGFGLLWTTVACALIVVDAADTNGLSVARGMTPEALGTMIAASNLPKAWIIAAVGACIVGFAAASVRTWRAAVLLLVIAGLSVLPPIVTGHVAVAANHDWETDAAMFGSIAVAIWLGALMVLGAHARRWKCPLPEPAATRMRRLSWWAFGIVVACDLIVDVFELAGTDPASTPTGRLMMARMAILIGIGLLQAAPGALGRRVHGEPSPFARLVPAAMIMLAFAYFGVYAAMDRIPPPRFFAADITIQKTLLGYTLPDPPSLVNLLTTWRVNILFLTIAVAGVAVYFWGLRRAAGRRWPVHRTICWIAGWVLVICVTSGGWGVYSPAMFSLHMVTHMVLNMIAPLLLVLGAPLTLARAAMSGRAGSPFAGPRQWVDQCVHSPLLRVLANPATVFVIFIIAYFGFYFTPAFTRLMIFHWGHQLVRLAFLAIGYLFYWLVIGADDSPKPLPALGKLAFVFAMMPFHAIFAIAIMSTDTIIGHTYFSYLDLHWMGSQAADQFAGGIIDWIGGEAPLLVVIVALLIGWMRSDRRPSTFSAETDSVLTGARR